MNSIELLCRATERQLDKLFMVAKQIPEDKLDWSPGEGSRSALDQLQECATAIETFWPSYEKRKMEWSDEMFREWMAERAKLKTMTELEAVCRTQVRKLLDFTKGLTEEQLDEKVQLPFPGDYTLADVILYNQWNMAYHEGQIMYLLQMMGEGGDSES